MKFDQLSVKWKMLDDITHQIERIDGDQVSFQYSNSAGITWHMSLDECESLTTQLLLFVPQSRNLSEGKPRNHNLAWTQDDDQSLRDLWVNDTTLDNFISQLHRSEGSIKTRLKYLGIADLSKAPKGSLNPQGPARGNLSRGEHEDQILINLFEEGSSIFAMSDTLERSESSIKSRLKVLGIYQ